MGRIRSYFLLFILFAVAVVVYTGILNAEFLYSWDDQWYVTDNPFIIDGLNMQSFTGVWTQFYFASYIPVTMLSYNIDYALWGLNPTGYHLTNIILHGANTILVFYAVQRIVNHKPRIVAAIAAVLFAVHPLQVEVVAWVAQRKSLLGMLFFLLTWLIYTHKRAQKLPALAGGWVMFAVTMLSKTSTIGAPMLFFLYDLEWRKMNPVKAILRAIPYGMISLVAAYLQVEAHRVVDGIKAPLTDSLLGRVQLALVVTWDYVVSLGYPLNLNNRYYYFESTLSSRWLATMLGALVVIALVVFAIRGGRLGRMTAAGIVLFMLPVSNIIPIAIQRADRYVYFPSVIIFLLVGVLVVWLWDRFERYQTFISGATGGVIAACMVLTVLRVDVWQNSGTLWNDHRSDYPNSSTGLLNEGVYYYNLSDFDYAGYLFTRLTDLHPDEWKGYRFLGHIAYQEEDYQEAVAQYRLFLTEAPEDELGSVQRFLGELLFNIGLAAHNADDYTTANSYYQQALAYLPENAVVYNNIGFNHFTAGDPEQAILAYQQAIEINPDYARAYTNLRTAAQTVDDSELITFAEENLQRLHQEESTTNETP